MDDSRAQRTLDGGQVVPVTSGPAAQRVGERAGGAPGSGVDGHAGRLVDDDQVGVLVENDERQLLGEEIGPRALGEDDDLLPGDDAGDAAEDGPFGDPDPSGGEEIGDPGDAVAAEQLVEPQSGLVHLDADGRPKIIQVRFVVEEDFHGYRVDLYLKRKIRRLSRTKIQEIIRTQLIGPGGRRLKAHSPVSAGEVLVIHRPARPEPPAPRTFAILHDDPDFIVIDKPANLAVHATARYYFTTLTRLLGDRFPGAGMQICHRLDRETSGCLVVARGKAAAARLKGAFERRKIGKTYLALVHGSPAWVDDEHVIDLPLALVPPERSRLRVRMEPAVGGLSAVTRVRVVERGVKVTLVSCTPVTGRQHQIRAHLAAVGHPIVGDKLYAHGDDAFARYCDRDANGMTDADVLAEFGMMRQALHAASITFPHPRTGLPVTVECPLPSDIQAFLAQDRTNAPKVV